MMGQDGLLHCCLKQWQKEMMDLATVKPELLITRNPPPEHVLEQLSTTDRNEQLRFMDAASAKADAGQDHTRVLGKTAVQS